MERVLHELSHSYVREKGGRLIVSLSFLIKSTNSFFKKEEEEGRLRRSSRQLNTPPPFRGELSMPFLSSKQGCFTCCFSSNLELYYRGDDPRQVFGRKVARRRSPVAAMRESSIFIGSLPRLTIFPPLFSSHRFEDGRRRARLTIETDHVGEILENTRSDRFIRM